MPVSINNTQIVFNDSTTQTTAAGPGLASSGQTYQNVTGSRTRTTTYTNSTGRPIGWVIIGADAGGQPLSLVVTIGSSTFPTQGGSPAGNQIPRFFAIPPGVTYSANWNASASFNSWWELRS